MLFISSGAEASFAFIAESLTSLSCKAKRSDIGEFTIYIRQISLNVGNYIFDFSVLFIENARIPIKNAL